VLVEEARNQEKHNSYLLYNLYNLYITIVLIYCNKRQRKKIFFVD
jgi:hypothetical protein